MGREHVICVRHIGLKHPGGTSYLLKHNADLDVCQRKGEDDNIG